ncbi:hypothetical protein MVEN_00259900 [Mycena venus]|uniref:Transmembrane protein n=1 Tax=Mycena venus TaxID=2733690 RepID=A0A8H6Z1X0_9AGAR|nr:hypothetical protein MVEN_00259900 [Mycena venus]
MDFVHSMEKEYGRPAKDFLAQSFRECPTVTSIGVVFSIISFVPVVTAIALFIIICFLTAAGIFISVVALLSGGLVAVVTLFLLLSTILSAALVLSATTALVMSSDVWCRTPRVETQDADTTTPSKQGISGYLIPITRFFTSLISSLVALQKNKVPSSWRLPIFALILLRNPIARILLPRWMRYRSFYPWVFGRNRNPHPLKWAVLRVLWAAHPAMFPRRKIASFVFKAFRLAVRLLADLGWDSVLIVCVLLAFLSPKVRERAIAPLYEFLRRVLVDGKEGGEGGAETRVSDPDWDEARPSEETLTEEIPDDQDQLPSDQIRSSEFLRSESPSDEILDDELLTEEILDGEILTDDDYSDEDLPPVPAPADPIPTIDVPPLIARGQCSGCATTGFLVSSSMSPRERGNMLGLGEGMTMRTTQRRNGSGSDCGCE